ncbi:flagellar filament capping protein FliD [Pantoea sp. AS142]|uniref:flagellar filament capping protein FliD n=1 Tax=Pantoea sp. AS142 TaxID=3081292 RepID=UPI003017F86C
MAISSTASAGVGGWDYTDLLNGMAQNEQLRLTPYTNLQTSCKNKVSAWGSISSLMTALQGSVKKLNGEAFNTMKVSTNTAFTATATDSASADTHAVTVEELATAHKLKTDAFDSADKQLGSATEDGTRTVTITQGDGKALKVELKDDETSLNQIASAINKKNTDQGGSVTASVQRDGSGQYQLMISSKKTGTDGEMSVSVDGGDDKLSGILNTSKGGKGSNEAGSDADKMTLVSAAQDAKLSVDGIEYTRSSNNISDIITGVTLNLNAKSKDSEPEQLTLTVDTSAIKTTLQDFVKQYNALLSETSADSKYVAPSKDDGTSSSTGKDTAKSGALMGDSTLRGLVNNLRSAANNSYGSSSLSDMGITIDSQSGQMTLNESKLDKAIADDPDAISKVFQGSGDSAGLANTLGTIVTKYLGDSDTKTDGIIKSATDDLNTQLKNVADQVTKTQALIDSKVELLRSQYANADALFNQMTNMSNTLTSMFAKA